MEKIIRIDENHEITLNNNVWWLIIYKSQFGHDIVPDLMPIVSGIMDLLVNLADVVDSETNVKEMIKKIDPSDLSGALVELASLQITDFINILWAMAKAADESIPEPSKWVRSFERFPLDILVPEAGSLIIQGMVSEKNWNSLQNLFASLKARSGQKR